MGKRSNKYSGSKMNRAARRRDEKEQIAAMELLLDARWVGRYFISKVRVPGQFDVRVTYYTREGVQLSAMQAHHLDFPKKKTRPHIRGRGKSMVTTQGNFLGPSLSRKGRDVMDGAFEPIHNDPLYHSTMGR